ncbi:unnamed protein product [Caenorhabditis brenneri]
MAAKNSNSGESGSQFSKSEKSASPEICRKWSQLVFKIYERMIHSSEVSFFISSPQIISSLGFILASCDPKATETLVKVFENGSDDVDLEFIIDHTLKLVHKWSGEFRSLVSPGQYHRARRVYAHPKFVNPHKENTFLYFRMFRVEEKIFEGPKDAQNWAARTLKTEFSPSQRVLNMWQWDQNHFDRMRQKRMAEELSSKVRSKDQKNKKMFPKKGLLPVISSNIESDKSRNEVNEGDRKSPILVWTSHVVVEIPDEFLDGKHVYSWNHREYLKIHESPAVPIRVQKGKFDFTTVILPTQNRQLLMLIFYGYDSKLCSMEEMKKFVAGNSSLKANRIAQHVVASVNLHSLFVSGGFGDLAVADSVPSASGDPKKVSHLQHYGLLSFRNAPSEKPDKALESQTLLGKTTKSKKNDKKKSEKSSIRPLVEPNANEIEMIPYPICVILWDMNRELPAYMGKVTGELTPEEIEEKDEAEKARKQRKKWWFC